MAGILIGTAIVGAVTGIASAVVGGVAQSNANRIALNTTQLGQRQESELARALAEKQDKTQRLKIYADSIQNVRIAQQNALIQGQITAQQTSADAQKKNLVIVSIGGGAIAIASLFVLRK
jgi:7-cyano-7-deazaguanine synthase in queuosine biosynthesis